MSETTVFRTCPLCEATCGLAITLSDNRVTGIRGDQDDEFSRGYICPKGANLNKLHEDPERLRRPLIRNGRQWTEVSWETAFAEVEKGLTSIKKQYGQDAVAVYLGNPNTHTIASIALPPLLKSIRSKNTYSSSSVDQLPKQMACGLMYGNPNTIPIPDLDRTAHLLIIGANPLASNGSLCTAPDFPGRLKAIKNRGGKIVVVDPKKTATAMMADEHHFIRPGTDALLLFAMISTLFENNRIKPGNIAQLINGLETVKELSKQFTPEKVSPVCGISAADIRRMAIELADADTAVVYGRMGASTVLFGGLTNWLVDVLNIITGNFDKPGGAMFTTPAHLPLNNKTGKEFRVGRWRSRVQNLPEILGEFPVATLADEIETPGESQIRSLICITGNPVISNPNSRRLDKALSTLDFMVSVDYYLNETSRHAHVILPATSQLSQGHYDFVFNLFSVRNIAKYSKPVLPVESDEMSFWEILTRLTLITSGMGASADPAALDEYIIRQMIDANMKLPESKISQKTAEEVIAALKPLKGTERMLDFLLRTGPYGNGFDADNSGLSYQKLIDNPHGIDLGPLMPRLPEILSTSSAKIELAPAFITDDVPRLEAFMNSSPTKGFLLIGRRDLKSNNSWMHNIPALVSGRPRCTLQINPDDARNLNVSAGDNVCIKSRVGSITAPVEVTSDLMPGVVSLPHGWGHDLPDIRISVAQAHAGINSNILADETSFDLLSGNSVLNGIPVEIFPES